MMFLRASILCLVVTFGTLPHAVKGADMSSSSAKLLVDEYTGAIVVIGGTSEARSDPVIRVIEDTVVSQPPPFSSGQTVVVPRTRIEIDRAASDKAPDRTIRIVEEPQVSHPPPFAKGGRSVVVPRTRIIIEDPEGRTWAPLRPNESAQSLVEKLNQLGLSRTDLIAVLDSLKRWGIYRGDVTLK